MNTLHEIICNGIESWWNAMKMVFAYSILFMLIIMVGYLIYRIEVEVAKDKANK
jgi:hypothetical protein